MRSDIKANESADTDSSNKTLTTVDMSLHSHFTSKTPSKRNDFVTRNTSLRHCTLADVYSFIIDLATEGGINGD